MICWVAESSSLGVGAGFSPQPTIRVRTMMMASSIDSAFFIFFSSISLSFYNDRPRAAITEK